MEKGQMRCDANVSVRLRGEDRLGTRTELKNINSFRFVQNAVEHEIARQIRIIDGGGRVERETRLWDADAGQSAPMRSQGRGERLSLLPGSRICRRSSSTAPMMGDVLRSLPELPAARFDALRQSEHGLARRRRAHARRRSRARRLLRRSPCKAHPGEQSAARSRTGCSPSCSARSTPSGKPIAQSPMPPATLSALVRLVEDGTISGKIGKEIFEESYRTGEAPRAIVERRGVQQISDEADAVGDRRSRRRREPQAGRRSTPAARTACSGSSSARS